MAKILIVDDEREFVEMLSLRLSRVGGYEVLTAFDGQEGVDSAKKNLPDLILLDIMMPKLSGVEAIELLKKDPSTKSIPIIILTASVNPQTTDKFLSLGATDYVLKPFDPIDLMEKIKKGLLQK